MEIAPPRIIIKAQTVAKTGRRIKKSTNKRRFRLPLDINGEVHSIAALAPSTLVRGLSSGVGGYILNLLRHRHAVLQELRAGDNQVVAGL